MDRKWIVLRIIGSQLCCIDLFLFENCLETLLFRFNSFLITQIIKIITAANLPVLQELHRDRPIFWNIFDFLKMSFKEHETCIFLFLPSENESFRLFQLSIFYITSLGPIFSLKLLENSIILQRWASLPFLIAILLHRQFLKWLSSLTKFLFKFNSFLAIFKLQDGLIFCWSIHPLPLWLGILNFSSCAFNTRLSQEICRRHRLCPSKSQNWYVFHASILNICQYFIQVRQKYIECLL